MGVPRVKPSWLFQWRLSCFLRETILVDDDAIEVIDKVLESESEFSNKVEVLGERMDRLFGAEECFVPGSEEGVDTVIVGRSKELMHTRTCLHKF